MGLIVIHMAFTSLLDQYEMYKTGNQFPFVTNADNLIDLDID